MLKVSNVDISGWRAAIRGMRNPMNSWEKSDSYISDCDSMACDDCPYATREEGMPPEWTSCNIPKSHQGSISELCHIGQNDLDLMKRLAKAGKDHRKFARMIHVSMDICAPLYWIAEHDTYKVGTTRNSCSFMHKGTSRPYNINDFSVADKRVYEILSPIAPKTYPLVYPYETNEYRTYTTKNGRNYKIYKNGRIVRCAFDCSDSYCTGRIRHFDECEVTPSSNACGYYEINIGGRNGEKWLVHRLVGLVWHDNPNNYKTINHIDGNKGNNSAENLEWCTLEDNIKKRFDDGLYDNNKLHASYIKWKNAHTNVDPFTRAQIVKEWKNGTSTTLLSEIYELPKTVVTRLVSNKPCENDALFSHCSIWEKIIDNLNVLRQEYVDTKNDNIFFEIRQLMPQGYNVRYTWDANYEVLANIYFARRNHRLEEWHTFCDEIEKLPYFTDIFGIEKHEEKE